MTTTSEPTHAGPTAAALSLEHVKKAFGSHVVLDDVSLAVAPGEVLALLGENGAGKTTLMRIASGLERPDEGEIRIRGERCTIGAPADALAQGIAIVQQHFSLIGKLSIAENVVLGRRRLSMSRLSRKKINAEVMAIADRYHIGVDPNARVDELAVDQQAKVEIVKALHLGARVLILDEPTSSLGPQQIEELFQVVGRMTSEGIAVILVTHRLGEVLEIAKSVVVLRDGCMAAVGSATESTPESLTRAMVGHDLVSTRTSVNKVDDQIDRVGARSTATPSASVSVEIEDLRLWLGHRGEGISLQAPGGRVLGVVGVEGNGQTELLEVLAGLRKPAEGRILLNGANITGKTPAALHALGITAISGDRHRWDMIAPLSVQENFALHGIASGQYKRRGGFIDWRRVTGDAERMVDEFDVRPGTASQSIGSLSGGNQQKIVIARALSQDLRVLVLGQPTRGLDVGARQFVHDRVMEARDAGVAVILVSFDLDEVFDLADDIIVLFRGSINYRSTREDAQISQVGAAMTGLQAEAAQSVSR